MGKEARKSPRWWVQHKRRIIKELGEIQKQKRSNFEKNNTKKDWSWDKQLKRQRNIDFAKLNNNNRAFSKLLHIEQKRIPIMLTMTIAPPSRLKNTDQSFDACLEMIRQQVTSLIFHMRTLSKSKIFADDKKVDPHCPHKRRFQYEWALELQASGDVHIHAVVSLRKSVSEVIRFTELIHELRNRYRDVRFTARDKKEGQDVLPMGRTHLSIPGDAKELIIDHFAKKGIRHVMWHDKEDSTRENYFFPALSPEININSGQGTLLEFVSTEEMIKRYKKLQKYKNTMIYSKYKLSSMISAMSTEIIQHNLKGRYDKHGDDKSSRAVGDAAVFEYLGIRLFASSQVTFPVSLYQKIRKQLMEYLKKYKNLWEVSLDWCKGTLVVEGKSPNRIIWHRGELIARESKEKKKIAIDEIYPEQENKYLMAKEGM